MRNQRPPIPPKGGTTSAVPIPAILQIVVQCKTEEEQRDLYERLKKEGFPCRVLTL
jgi:hypothetical protein